MPFLPGDGWAATFPELALPQPLERVWSLGRSVAPFVVVDDIILHRIGSNKVVTREIAQASKALQ
eukprot:3204492-Pyramimonas_sp.AAC.1